MEFIIRQQELLGELASIMHVEAQEGYEQAALVLTARPENSKATAVESYFKYRHAGETKSSHFSFDNDDQADNLVFELHELMRQHTGGAWSEMTLTLTADGQLKTDFKYPDAE